MLRWVILTSFQQRKKKITNFPSSFFVARQVNQCSFVQPTRKNEKMQLKIVAMEMIREKTWWWWLATMDFKSFDEVNEFLWGPLRNAEKRNDSILYCYSKAQIEIRSDKKKWMNKKQTAVPCETITKDSIVDVGQQIFIDCYWFDPINENYPFGYIVTIHVQ